MSGIRPVELAALLGLYPKNAKEFTSLDLAAAVVRGLAKGWPAGRTGTGKRSGEAADVQLKAAINHQHSALSQA